MSYLFFPNKGVKKAAIFMSGSGSNAIELLKSLQTPDCKNWMPKVLVSDSPERSRVFEIAEQFNLPVVSLDIRKFYHARGEKRVSIRTEIGRSIREEWTNELRKMIAPYEIDFIILAGFIPLSNITSDYPCLNVHPGDLTIEKDGRRLLVGLHTLPIETAILMGNSSLRTSVIIAQAYTGSGGEMDMGPIIGISPEVDIDFMGHSLDELKVVADGRPEFRPIGGYKDILEEIASHNQELLKEGGDWKVFPPAVENFAAGKFALDGDQLLYRLDDSWSPVKSVIYGDGTPQPI